jgi:hypothetical protein
MYDDLSPHFEKKLLTVATRFVFTQEDSTEKDTIYSDEIALDFKNMLTTSYATSWAFSVLIGFSEDEIKAWATAYHDDPHFSKVLKGWKGENNWSNPSIRNIIIANRD